ncbi:alpha-galactosidase [Tirmania nivea]|nr:alpha-galactosidase [Tirmania nivea]
MYFHSGDTRSFQYFMKGSLGTESIDTKEHSKLSSNVNCYIQDLKYDNCNVPAEDTDTYTYWPENWYGGGVNERQDGIPAPAGYDWSTSKTAKRYNAMRDALHTDTKRNILYFWGNKTGQSRRMWGDIVSRMDGKLEWSWGFMPIVNHGIFFLEYSDFWGHNDLDMLEVGNGAFTEAETRTHFGLWAALKSPLLIGTPLKNQTHPAEFYTGLLGATVIFAEILGLSKSPNKKYEVRDMWNHRKLGVFKGNIALIVVPHDLAALLITESCSDIRIASGQHKLLL